jgi:hypothetical protein
VAVTQDALQAHYTGTIDWLHAPSNVGLKSIAAMAVLAWDARVSLGAAKEQIEQLVLGPRPDALMVERFRRARGLALFWQRNGVPKP